MDIAQLTPEQLASLKAQLGLVGEKDPMGRSPIRPRQLHDLRLLPTKDDPRPTFFWSAEAPRDGVDLGKTTEFPKLMWHAINGDEITVNSRDEQAGWVDRGYVLTAPAVAAELTAEQQQNAEMNELQAAFDALPEEDRTAIMTAQRQQRISALSDRLSGLPEASLESLLNSAKAQATGKKKTA